MKPVKLFIRCSLFAVLAMTLTLSFAQRGIPKITATVNGQEAREQPYCFSLGSESGNRMVIPLDVRNPGMFTAKVVWEGTAQSLALILNGPGQTGYYAREDGRSPLYFQFKFNSAHLAAGGAWRLSLANFGQETKAQGTILVYYPIAGETPSEGPAAQPEEPGIMYTDFMKLDRSTWGEGKNQFLPDGSFRINYPNGFYILRKPDKSLYFYNAGEQVLYKVIKLVLHANVQTADAPPSVDSFTGVAAGNEWLNDFYAWIDDVNKGLLKEIKTLFDQDQAMINNYLQLEKNKSVFEILTFRLETIDELRELCNE